MEKCNHQAMNGGQTFTCNRPFGHQGLHEETIQLRGGPEVTSWGDDGLASWATRDQKRLDETAGR